MYSISPTNYAYKALEYLLHSFDIQVDLFVWYWWVLTPIFVTLLLPLVILFLLYISACIVHLYRCRHHLSSIQASINSGNWRDCARRTIGVIWDAHGWIWHGYEIQGIENIPDSGPALIIYYHGAIPLDYYYLMAKVVLKKNRTIRTVADRFLFSIPGWRLLMEVFQIFPGTISTCVDVLRKGELLSISPGGVREAQFGDSSYRLIWGHEGRQRIGFAKVALEAGVPIIPMFTVNLRESFRSLGLGQWILQKLYNQTRLPLVPIYGGFPVKLKTIIGEPIPYDDFTTPQQLADRTAEAIEQMIREHQRVPGSILQGILDRFRHPLPKPTYK